MKLRLLSPALAGLLLVSCSTVNSVTQQLSSPLSVQDDPLGSPLKKLKSTSADVENVSNSGVSFPAGTLVETALPDAQFFRKYPLFGRGASNGLGVSTSAKVLSQRGSYTKVELSSGDVGYIPSVALIEKIDYEPAYIEPSEPERIPIASPSDPPPPTEEEILRKINERQDANRAPEPSTPTPSSTNSNVAPPPSNTGINPPSDVTPSPAPPAVPQVPTVPQTPQAPPVSVPEVVAPPLPAQPDIKIDKPSDTGTRIPISAPPGAGGALNQDSSLELRVTERNWR